jgi:hypothetical protein
LNLPASRGASCLGLLWIGTIGCFLLKDAGGHLDAVDVHFVVVVASDRCGGLVSFATSLTGVISAAHVLV